MLRKTLTLSILIFLVGCSAKVHHYKAYDENQNNTNNIATLKVPGDVYIHEIDGKSGYYPSYISDISPYDGARIKILSGRHNIKLNYRSSGKRSWTYTAPQIIMINAQAGKSYAIYPVTKHTMNKTNEYRTATSILFQFVECNSNDELKLREQRKKNFGKIYVPMCEEKTN